VRFGDRNAFQKKNVKARLTKEWGSLREVAWDDETVERIAKIEVLAVNVTHIQRTTVRGGNSRRIFQPTTAWEAHGVMTLPKFIPVKITFTKEPGEFGGFDYALTDTLDEPPITLPVLKVWLSDEKEQKTLIIAEALRDAILSGRKSAHVRFFKNIGEGLLTQVDREKGCSGERRYLIVGMTTFQELHAGSLPRWGLPTDHRYFSIYHLPQDDLGMEHKLIVTR
jgi:hypothetical protein